MEIRNERMPKIKYPKIEHHIVCDDIRLEIGGKASLMGVYQSDILVPAVPFLFPKLCFRVIFSNVETINKIIISFLAPDKKVIANSEIDSVKPLPPEPIKRGRKTWLTIDLTFAGIKIEKEGIHKLIFKFDGDKSRQEVKINIKKRSDKK